MKFVLTLTYNINLKDKDLNYINNIIITYSKISKNIAL